MTKKEMINKIKEYYKKINRDKIPKIENYTKKELIKVMYLFNLYEQSVIFEC